MLASRGWVDAEHAAPVLQRGLAQAESVVEDLADVEIAGAPIVTPVLGVPDDAAPAWTFSKAARSALDDERLRADRTRRATPRPEIAMDWARARGRISSTELASIVGAAPPNVGPVLRKLEDQGQLEPGRQARRGPGFFYRPAADIGPN
ncbi:hypothetical protein [Promicromonospora sp. NPDC023805]|uniref:hypothetical protein n=1 Tax=Promicromonospora sp. NPDC023805 TaxID=3154696 RepID=UPI0033E04F4B